LVACAQLFLLSAPCLHRNANYSCKWFSSWVVFLQGLLAASVHRSIVVLLQFANSSKISLADVDCCLSFGSFLLI
jgi:hypothetical protein